MAGKMPGAGEGGFPGGFPGGPGVPPFDFSALQSVLSVRAASPPLLPPVHSLMWSLARRLTMLCDAAQDPSIKQMAEQIAQDPAFAQMTQALQASISTAGGDHAQVADAPEEAVENVAHAPPGMPAMDPQKYADAMQNLMQNPQFMEMATKLGNQLISVRLWYPGNIRPYTSVASV